MTWINFILWLCALYTAYYAVIIMTDLFKKGRIASGNKPGDLTFAEHFMPVKPEIATKPGSAIMSSGGKTIQDIFSLARDEAIVFTRAVSF